MSNLVQQSVVATELVCSIGTDSNGPVVINPAMINRHGLIAGATGTGKTVTLQVLAGALSELGIPVFLSDVKGDLAGLAKPIQTNEKILTRVSSCGIDDFQPRGYPVLFWDVFGKQGHPVCTTISEMGPLLLGRLLDLNDTQQGVLEITFRLADEQGLLLLDIKDLRSMLTFVEQQAEEIRTTFGNIAATSVGAVQRKLLSLEDAGGNLFFGEPALRLEDLMQRDFSGQGVISIFDAKRLLENPKIYSTLLLWLLSELFEELPEVGDTDLPKLVFFFDEAHLLFGDIAKALLDKIEQVVRLIRSKGVGIFFVSQSPLDIPESVLGQLGARFQHALRGATPQGQKEIRAAANTLASNPEFSSEEVISKLAVGEALVSVLERSGQPTPVRRTLIRPPSSRIGTLSDTERAEIISRSPIRGRYEEVIDRESAYELLKKKEQSLSSQTITNPTPTRPKATSRKATPQRQSVGEAFVKSIARSLGSQVGRQLVRGVLGSLLGGKSKR